ncbi:hypothetical protein ACFV2U_55030 [Streptomyces sp. NPDC059697]|uniref:hypothetical protein n=1 Tax=Streptomyces sp. NPDC059697 TaxID=3346912 RepID=UPI003687ACEA
MTSDNPVQDRIWELQDAERDALALLDRALHLARRLTTTGLGNLRQPWAALANRAVRLAVAFHYRAERAAADLDDFINHLERQGR